MSSEMQERIALAMAEKRREFIGRPLATIWPDLAIAAMRAMSEPSFQAQVSGRDAILAENDDVDLSSDDARACWRAMLDFEIQAAEEADHD